MPTLKAQKVRNFKLLKDYLNHRYELLGISIKEAAASAQMCSSSYHGKFSAPRKLTVYDLEKLCEKAGITIEDGLAITLLSEKEYLDHISIKA